MQYKAHYQVGDVVVIRAKNGGHMFRIGQSVRIVKNDLGVGVYKATAEYCEDRSVRGSTWFITIHEIAGLEGEVNPADVAMTHWEEN
ncbi:BAH domain-containing protein [Pseudomonas phage EM]|uniref:BAH domain-containing protein n=1 Tax=Pseudomonas phage EM TaxID=2936914 RepID=A0AAE9HG53_9CAUD|nr:BAH domain-containing protein [Pseudomonas phage EM]UPW35920.1 BAH domain-containing protein [Pseudomonas phage EM]